MIRSELRPGDLGRLIALHGVAYADEPGERGLPFEAYVARTVADFVIGNEARGRGLGGRLVDAALDHARSIGGGRVFLETTAGLAASMALDRRRGFEIVSERREKLWTGEDQVIIMEKVYRR